MVLEGVRFPNRGAAAALRQAGSPLQINGSRGKAPCLKLPIACPRFPMMMAQAVPKACAPLNNPPLFFFLNLPPLGQATVLLLTSTWPFHFLFQRLAPILQGIWM